MDKFIEEASVMTRIHHPHLQSLIGRGTAWHNTWICFFVYGSVDLLDTLYCLRSRIEVRLDFDLCLDPPGLRVAP
jgi:hypothetical protein